MVGQLLDTDNALAYKRAISDIKTSLLNSLSKFTAPTSSRHSSTNSLQNPQQPNYHSPLTSLHSRPEDPAIEMSRCTQISTL